MSVVTQAPYWYSTVYDVPAVAPEISPVFASIVAPSVGNGLNWNEPPVTGELCKLIVDVAQTFPSAE